MNLKFTTMKTLKQTFGNSLITQTAGKSFMRKIFLGVLILLFSTANYAQDPQWQIFNTSNSGLPSNNLGRVVIDEDGTKWIGTDDGLAKFDGTNWTVYNTSNSGLPDSDMSSNIAIDQDGVLWFGAKYYGLVKFDGTNCTIYNSSNSGLPNNFIYTIAIDGDGVKWIGTGVGLAKFDGTTWTTYNSSNSGIPDGAVTSIAIDDNGSLWIGSDYWVFDPNNPPWFGYDYYYLSKYDGTNWTNYDALSSWLLVIDENGDIWCGGSSWFGFGLGKFDGINWTSYSTSNSGLPSENVNAIAIQDNGWKWIGTYDEGLVKFDGTNWTTYNTSNSELPSNDIRSIAFDENGSKWIGTQGGGLAVYNENGFTVGVDENKLSQNNATRIYPNPSKGQITVDLKDLTDVSINVYSLSGSRIYHQENITGPQYQFELNADAGIYILEVSTQKETQRYKLVKE